MLNKVRNLARTKCGMHSRQASDVRYESKNHRKLTRPENTHFHLKEHKNTHFWFLGPLKEREQNIAVWI